MGIKYFRISILFFLLIPLVLFCKNKEPDWFRNLIPTSHEIIGYGESDNLEQARAIAKKEIANTIQTQIISETVSKTTEEKNEVNESIRTFIESKTNVVLSDLVTLKEKCIKNTWYVALKYDNLTLEKKFASKISKPVVDKKQNNYLAKTPLLKSINSELNCNLDIEVKRKNNLWYLAYGDIMLPLSPNDFEKFFISTKSNVIQINTSPSNLLYEGDIFHFNIVSSENGFFAIINVYENGECFIIQDKLPIIAEKEVIIPDDFSDHELVAGLLNENQPTSDLYIVLYSKEEINLSRFQEADDTIKINEYHFKFDEILEMMDNYEFATVLIRTEPKF